MIRRPLAPARRERMDAAVKKEIERLRGAAEIVVLVPR